MNQIRKARGKWNAIGKILKREGASAKTMAKFYLTVVQAVLLYGSDSWTVTKANGKRLEAFHHRAVEYDGKTYSEESGWGVGVSES